MSEQVRATAGSRPAHDLTSTSGLADICMHLFYHSKSFMARGRWRPCTGCSAVTGVSRRKVCCRCRATCLLVPESAACQRLPESACMSACARERMHVSRLEGCESGDAVGAQGSWRQVTCCVRSCLCRSSCNALSFKCKAPSSEMPLLTYEPWQVWMSSHKLKVGMLLTFSLRSGHHPRPHMSAPSASSAYVLECRSRTCSVCRM